RWQTELLIRSLQVVEQDAPRGRVNYEMMRDDEQALRLPFTEIEENKTHERPIGQVQTSFNIRHRSFNFRLAAEIHVFEARTLIGIEQQLAPTRGVVNEANTKRFVMSCQGF